MRESTLVLTRPRSCAGNTHGPLSDGTRAALVNLLCDAAGPAGDLRAIMDTPWLQDQLPCGIEKANALCDQLSTARATSALAAKVRAQVAAALQLPVTGFVRVTHPSGHTAMYARLSELQQAAAARWGASARCSVGAPQGPRPASPESATCRAEESVPAPSKPLPAADAAGRKRGRNLCCYVGAEEVPSVMKAARRHTMPARVGGRALASHELLKPAKFPSCPAF